MSNHLQELLTEIEAEATKRSELAVMNAEVVEAAYSIRDAMIRVGFTPTVCEHYHYAPKLIITITTHNHREQELRDACAALGIVVADGAACNVVAPGVEIIFRSADVAPTSTAEVGEVSHA